MMQQYVGTKIVTAWESENDGAPGFAVKYADGYISWSPKEMFEAAYLPLGGIEHLEPHQQRMVAELAELEARGSKLGLFLISKDFHSLDEVERELLRQQAGAMIQYASALRARVERFHHAGEK